MGRVASFILGLNELNRGQVRRDRAVNGEIRTRCACGRWSQACQPHPLTPTWTVEGKHEVNLGAAVVRVT